MKKLTFAAALLAAAAIAAPAHAADAEGKFQVKLLGTAVLPDGKITNSPGLPAGSQTKANDNYVPTLAIEYFATPNISIETICCFTGHHVDGTGTLANLRLADHVLILPATLTLKAHADLGAIKPYVGAGPALFLYFGEKPGPDAVTVLGATRLKLDNKVGVALQAGVDMPINDSGMAISIDAKKYFMSTTAHFYAGTTEALTTDHKLDPWVLSAGVAFRF